MLRIFRVWGAIGVMIIIDAPGDTIGPPEGKAVSGGSRRRGNDNTVCIVGIQVFLIYIVVKTHHSKGAVPADHNIIQGNIASQHLVSPGRPSL